MFNQETEKINFISHFRVLFLAYMANVCGLNPETMMFTSDPALLCGEAATCSAAAFVTFMAGCVYLNVHLNIMKQEITRAVSPVMGTDSDNRGDGGHRAL